MRVKRKFTTLTFVLSLLKEGEGALEGGEAGRKGKKDCRNRVSHPSRQAEPKKGGRAATGA
ncbi:MAG: hypothetical protein HYY81_05545 [Deltaproteobacteria bacterium]|nr:hypothetical protein [Deltaproteobacteria bacterium]